MVPLAAAWPPSGLDICAPNCIGRIFLAHFLSSLISAPSACKIISSRIQLVVFFELAIALPTNAATLNTASGCCAVLLAPPNGRGPGPSCISIVYGLHYAIHPLSLDGRGCPTRRQSIGVLISCHQESVRVYPSSKVGAGSLSNATGLWASRPCETLRA